MCHSVKQNYFIWSLITSICIVILGSGWHFLYSICGESKLVAWFAPVNESVWEHLKLTLYPILIVLLIFHALHLIPNHPPIWQVMLVAATSILTANLIIVSIYYVFAGGFHLSGMAVDLTAYGIGILSGQIVAAVHILPFRKIPRWVSVLGCLYLVIMLAITAIFSYYPPDVPIFIPPVSGS